MVDKRRLGSSSGGDSIIQSADFDLAFARLHATCLTTACPVAFHVPAAPAKSGCGNNISHIPHPTGARPMLYIVAYSRKHDVAAKASIPIRYAVYLSTTPSNAESARVQSKIQCVTVGCSRREVGHF